jgi:hypothetical protein
MRKLGEKQRRILDRKLAQEITTRELKRVIGGCATQTETCSGGSEDD